jgi:hypothetical protein
MAGDYVAAENPTKVLFHFVQDFAERSRFAGSRDS